METVINSMEYVLRKVEESVNYLDVQEWANEFEDYIKTKNVAKEEVLLNYLKTIWFYIKADYSEFFREIKTDFNDTYADIDFVYSINKGIEFTTNSCLVEVLEGSEDERVFDAIEDIMPEQLNSLKLQWVFWSEEQKKDFLLELDILNNKRISCLEQKLDESYFKKIEEEVKEVILGIALNEFHF